MFDAKETIFASAAVAWVALCIAGLIGWILNIAKIFQISQPVADWTAFEVGRAVGVVFAPSALLWAGCSPPPPSR